MKNRKGAVMIYTLIILTMLLLLGMSALSVTQSQTRSAIATDESVIAFFIAESGAENMLEKIYAGAANGQAFSQLNTGGNCDGGVFSESMSAGDWATTFYDTDGDQLTSCSDTGWRTEIDQMKVDGTYSGTVRSVRMSIDPAP
jgi:Tfp pilus assembly protein PilX